MVYFSLKSLNPEPATNNLNQHTLLLGDTPLISTKDGRVYSRMILGFEDLLRTSSSCDHDFNDMLLAVHVTPSDAVSNAAQLAVLQDTAKDSDGDGVKDSFDEFPNDSTAASSRWPLGKGVWGTLAYEDLWPSRGDYDLNDIVLRYQPQEILHANGLVSRLSISYRLDARGGVYQSGFALSLPGVLGSDIKTATLTVGDSAPKAVTSLFSATQIAAFQVIDNATTYMPAGTGTGSCAVYYNTGGGCPQKASTTFKLEVSFKTPLSSFPSAPYNPFIFRVGNAGLEVHLPGQQPSPRATASYFGTKDDNTVLSGSTYSHTYMDAKGLPWALNIPKEWSYPAENMEVASAYASIIGWAQSGGKTNTTWYVTPSNPAKTFAGK